MTESGALSDDLGRTHPKVVARTNPSISQSTRADTPLALSVIGVSDNGSDAQRGASDWGDRAWEWPLVFRCMLALLAAYLACRALGGVRAARGAARVVPRPAGLREGARDRANAIAHAIVCAAALLPGRVQCLEQSIALFVVLRREHLPARLRFGAQAHPFLAHAWVECDGEPLNENREQLARIVPFPDFSA